MVWQKVAMTSDFTMIYEGFRREMRAKVSSILLQKPSLGGITRKYVMSFSSNLLIYSTPLFFSMITSHTF